MKAGLYNLMTSGFPPFPSPLLPSCGKKTEVILHQSSKEEPRVMSNKGKRPSLSNHLLSSLAKRDFTGCLGENAINVAPQSSSHSRTTATSSGIGSSTALPPSMSHRSPPLVPAPPPPAAASAARPSLSNHLLSSLAKRDITGCLGENAINVAPQSSSHSRTTATSGGIGSSTAPACSPQSTVTSLYRTTLSTHEQRLIRVTWSKGGTGSVFSVALEESNGHPPPPAAAAAAAAEGTSKLVRRKKGSWFFTSGNLVIGLHWDISAATYGVGLEPVKDFYIVVVVDSEFGLLLGDLSKEFIRKFGDKYPVAEFSMVSRTEEVLGATVYATKARFHDGGRDHEILIRCKGDASNIKDAELSVCVDKKKVVNVKRIQWNFRGNQTLFIDGVAVDILWDIHDWWFCSSSRTAVFMFRTRSALESRLWLDVESGGGSSGFSLLIRAMKGQ